MESTCSNPHILEHERSSKEHAFRFSLLIKERTGLFFTEAQLPRLLEAIRVRMSERRMESLDEYYRFLVCDRVEFIDLVNLLTVNETYFFREPVHLRALTNHLIPQALSRKKGGERVRILSAGCSTGEEPYSILMAAIEKMGPSATALLHLTGVDIDSNAIRKAKEGIYGRQSFRSFDPRFRDKYFESAGGATYRVKDPYRQMVDFQYFNLLSPLYPESLRGMDIVFYRNVSIYFDSSTQRKIFESLSAIMNEGGVLVTSSTETLSHNLEILTLTEVEGSFLYRKLSPSNAEKERGEIADTGSPFLLMRGAPDSGDATRGEVFDPMGEAGPWPMPSAAMDKSLQSDEAKVEGRGDEKSSDSLYEQALLLAGRKRYSEAMASLEKLLSVDATCVKAHVLRAHVLTNLERLEEAERACLDTMELDPLCLEAYLLLGLIAKIRRDTDQSVKRFKEALYIRSSCWVAHFHLAETYFSLGEAEKARSEYKIVMNLLEKGETADPGLNLFSLSISTDQIIVMCRHKLALPH